MLLTQARLPDGLSVWLMPTRTDLALPDRSSRAATTYLANDRATRAQPVQLETVASATSETRRVYEVVPYVPYDGFSKLKGVAAYEATQNVLGVRAVTVDD